MRLSMRRSAACVGVFLGGLLVAGAAFAHASLEVQEAKAGTFYKAVIKVPHGCNGEATRTVRVSLPDGFVSAKPMPKAGWTLATTKGAYGKTYSFLHGMTLSEGVREITWTGELPDEYYDEFVVMGFLAPELAAPGDLYFPVVQECATGSVKWVDVPGAAADGASPKAPAPRLRLLPAESK